MPATIEDVAKTAGVSTATVSRALRGLPNVAPSTRERIVRVAQELDYVITPHLSRLISGRRVVGLLAPLVDQWFFSKLLTVAELELLNLGYDAVRYNIDTPANQTALLRQLTSERLVDGFIIASVALSDEDREIVDKSDMALVTVESRRPEFDSVTIDNAAAAELATRHLINLGHRRIGFISGMESTLAANQIVKSAHPQTGYFSEVEAALRYTVPSERLEGYRRALTAAKIEFRPELVVNGNFSFEGGAEAMKLLYSVINPPTAVCAISDEMAIGALKTLRDLNLRVPADVSVIGFDDHDAARYVDLTTMRQPVYQFGI
jgi:LacI family repressor for deo operon, udp, cdd, tsx, nupC, and nupG